jgi:hypothetical protein
MGWVRRPSTPSRLSRAANSYVSSLLVVPLLCANVAKLCAARFRISAP